MLASPFNNKGAGARGRGNFTLEETPAVAAASRGGGRDGSWIRADRFPLTADAWEKGSVFHFATTAVPRGGKKYADQEIQGKQNL